MSVLHAQQVMVIEPRRGLGLSGLRELWKFRDLWWVLAARDLKVRYKQTLLGAAWALLQPVATMVVATLVIGRMLGVAKHVDGSYAAFVFAGIVPWTLFAAAVAAAGNSVVMGGEMLKKVYFPRLVLPLASVGAPLADFALAMVVLLGLMVWSGTVLSWGLLMLPLLAVSVLLAALGAGVALAALTVHYRDFRIVVPFMLQMWFFATPVLYPMPAGARWSWLLNLNPMHGVIGAFRAVVAGEAIDYRAWLISTDAALLVLFVGVVYFLRAERKFADVV